MDIYRMIKKRLIGRISGIIRSDEPMKRHTTFRIGGPARLLIWVWNLEDIRTVYTKLVKKKIPIFILGDGSNILVKDKGIDGVVLKISRMHKKILSEDIRILKETSKSMTLSVPAWLKKTDLLNFARKNSLSGVEFLWGIPGTVAGGVKMNAGNFLGKFSDIVNEIVVLNRDGKEKRILRDRFKYCYRSLRFWGGARPITEVVITLKKDSISNIEKRIKRLRDYRVKAQPTNYPNAGSIFINPKGRFAGRLIEEMGLKGINIGDAYVSEKHANFIVNKQNATARDVLSLIRKIRKQAKERVKCVLREEIRILGK